MTEILSNNLEPLIKQAIQEWIPSKKTAEGLLAAYDANKMGMLRYTKESLVWLRWVLGLQASKDLFWKTEIEALKAIVGNTVQIILKESQWNPQNATQTWPLAKDPSSLNLKSDLKGLIPIGDVMLVKWNYEKIAPTIEPIIQKMCALTGMDRVMILAICAQESRFNPSARSGAWADGLMQVMPWTMQGVLKFLQIGNTKHAWPEEKYYATLRETAKSQWIDINNLANSDNLTKNLVVWITYISYLIRQFGEVAGLRKYNAGLKINESTENTRYAGGVAAWKNVIAMSSKNSQEA